MRHRRDFEVAVRRGRRAGRRLLAAHLFDETTEGVPAPLVGFTVGRSVGNAPTRNRVKRRLRHLMRGRLTALPNGARLVIRANPKAATASSAELAADLDALLERVGAR